MRKLFKTMRWALAFGGVFASLLLSEWIVATAIWEGKSWLFDAVLILLASPFAPIVAPLSAWFFWPGRVTNYLYLSLVLSLVGWACIYVVGAHLLGKISRKSEAILIGTIIIGATLGLLIWDDYNTFDSCMARARKKYEAEKNNIAAMYFVQQCRIKYQ